MVVASLVVEAGRLAGVIFALCVYVGAGYLLLIAARATLGALRRLRDGAADRHRSSEFGDSHPTLFDIAVARASEATELENARWGRVAERERQRGERGRRRAA